MDKIAGRKAEKERLRWIYESDKAEFIAVYGRRRIGKTFLIREFFGKKICFELTGIYDASLQEQLENFALALAKSLKIDLPLKTPESWKEAFDMLIIFLEKKKGKSKKVIFLDELPWLNTARSGFLKYLEHFWNTYGSRRNDLILIVCGSAASWMIQNLVKAPGGLHNRLTGQIRLLPFNLSDTKEYLYRQKIHDLDHYQILLLYMVMGGIPYYLSFIRKGMSAAELIDELFFSEQGALRQEYSRLFSSQFEKSEQHEKIIEILAGKKSGMTRKEILANAGLKSGGTATAILEELEESGFIESLVPYGKKANVSIYRVADEFTLFYWFWLEPYGRRSPGHGTWMNLQSDQRFNVWSGYAFEGICLKHIEELRYSLRIEKIQSSYGPWRYVPPKDSGEEGAEIDLLIDRKDMVINLCEMKFCQSEFSIDRKYAAELRRKSMVFKKQTRTRKAIFYTLVTTFGLKENEYSNSLNASSVSMEGLFVKF